MTETRYWKRVGMRVTQNMAMEIESKMKAKGSYLDDDLEEFTAIDSSSSNYAGEISALFDAPDEFVETGDPLNGSSAVIDISYHYYQQNRKPRLMAIREELKAKFESEKDVDIAHMMSENESLDLEQATTKWESEFPVNVRTEAQQKWQSEFDEYVLSLQAEYGVEQQ
tara:strand:+ start:6169 stop:6672 length:504 start_codon:yes stop_codon:yes gene_type:complete